MQLNVLMRFVARDGNYLHSGTCMHAQTNVFALRRACNQVLYGVIYVQKKKKEINCSGHVYLYAADIIIYSKQISMSS